MINFNILSRRGGSEDGAPLATRMGFDAETQIAKLERFKVMSCPDSLCVERVDLDFSNGKNVLALSRNRPTFCGIRLENGKVWDIVFESKEFCRDFAKQAKGRLCLDGEFFAEEENAAGFEVSCMGDPNATLMIVGNSIFLKSSLAKSSSGIWRDVSNVLWVRDSKENVLMGEDDAMDALRIEFRARAEREIFLARLPYNDERKSLQIFSGTWNVGNAAAPTPRELSRSWVELAADSDQRQFDLYIFGLQECSKKDEWVRALSAAVTAHMGGDVDSAFRVAVVTMREVVLVVFARQGLRVTVLGQDVRATGIANAIGNKGAVGVGLDLHEFGTVAVISAHLSAFQDNVKRRAQDQRMILKHLNLRNGCSDAQVLNASTFPNAWSGENEEHDTIESFDRVVFVGDLNYRIDMGSSGTPEEFEKVELMARGGRWTDLAPYDQLGVEMRKEKVFFSFQEVKPIGSFPPTYRMNKDQQGYSNKRDQNPSYTDRILIRGDVDGMSYGANHELLVRPDRTLTISDHRPVFAALRWNEHGRIWRDIEKFQGAGHRDIILKINSISFRSISQSWSDRNLATVPAVDENTRFPELDAPAEGKSSTPIKRRLSGLTSSRYLLRRNNSSGTTSLGWDEDETMLLDDDFAGGSSGFDDALEFKLSASWTTDHPTPVTIVSSGTVRSFATVSQVLNSAVRVGVFTRAKTLIGYARFRLPDNMTFVDESYVDVPVGSRGARVGDLSLRLHLAP